MIQQSPLLGIYLDKTKSKRYMRNYVLSGSTHNNQNMETS